MLLFMYEVCFYVGLFYSAISLFGHIVGLLDFDMGGDFDADFDIDFCNVSPFKLVVIIPALTTFGGVGMITRNYNVHIVFSLLISILLGFIVGLFIYKGMLTTLYKAQKRSVVSFKHEAMGKEATVVVEIEPNRIGSIRYYVKDSLYTSPAKSIDNIFIESNSKVVIKHIEENVMIVQKIEE